MRTAADKSPALPAGRVRVYEDGIHKLEKRGADLEIQIADHCVGVSGAATDQQGWRVEDPRRAATQLASAFDRLEAHPNGPDDVPKTTATDTVRDELEAAIERETVIVLDEGDDLPNTDALSQLLAFDSVTIIATPHEAIEWLGQLDVDDGHPFARDPINLERYNVDKLTDILERRDRQGFHTANVVSSRQLREVAGVARNGIQRLWGAADIAQEREHYRIRDEDIRDGKERMAVDPAVEYRIAAVLPLGAVHDRPRGRLDLWDRVPRALQRDHRRGLP